MMDDQTTIPIPKLVYVKACYLSTVTDCQSLTCVTVEWLSRKGQPTLQK